MQPPRFYEFGERMRFSEGYLHGGIEQVLKARIPGCNNVRRADQQDDRHGTDYWADRFDLPPLSIDVKVRQEDFLQKEGKDDLALEIWSVRNRKPGWTRDQSKRTDYVLWYWQDTGRFFIIPFPILCKVFRRYWQQWTDEYKHAVQTSGAWQSECVYVPRSVVMEKVMAWTEGVVA